MLELTLADERVVALWAWLNHPMLNLGGTKISLVLAACLLVGGYVAWHLTGWVERALLHSFFPRFGIERGRGFTLARVARYLALVGSGVVSFHLAGVDLSGLAVVAGFLSIGVGFGLQNVTSNFIAGLIVLFERPIKPGDQIRIGDRVGIVQDVRLRSTTIQTFDGLSIIVPNSEFISQEVINYSYGDPRLRIHLPVGLAYGTPAEEAKALLLAVARAHPEVLAEPEPIVWLKGFGPSSLDFELLVWVADAALDRKVMTELYLALLEALEAQGLRLPYPQQDLHLHPTPALLAAWGGDAPLLPGPRPTPTGGSQAPSPGQG